MLRFIPLLLSLFFLSCNQLRYDSFLETPSLLPTVATGDTIIERGALLLTKFKSLDALKKEVQIEYFNDSTSFRRPFVRLTHRSNGQKVVSILKEGISQHDFLNARNGGFWDKVYLAVNSPYTLINKNELLRVYLMARRRDNIFGAGDVAFYDLAKTMLYNIRDDDLSKMRSEDLYEKGYLNTFNHITAQAFMTSIFSEKMADFIADIHERYNMAELVTGNFSPKQLADLEKGPIDNYVDMINNEWGQELGKTLKKKYQIHRKTAWTNELLANYLNDIQNYHAWALQVGFKPFRPQDEVVMKFKNKLNRVLTDVSRMR